MQSPELLSASLWLSLKPMYASAILSGKKRFELRRVAPRVLPGSIAIAYASAPTMALVGAFRVESVQTLPLAELWSLVERQSALSKAAFETYFSGKSEGTALAIGETWELNEDYGLSELRKAWPGFHPPQSYRYLSDCTIAPGVLLKLKQGPLLAIRKHKLSPAELEI